MSLVPLSCLSTCVLVRTELNETVGGKLTEFIQQINSCYPPEIVEYYSPNYSKRLLEKIEDYAPSL